MKTILSQLDTDLASCNQKMIWQAADKLGEYCEFAPSDIWPLVIKHGGSNSAEVRQAIATCVLEHILQYHFDAFFPRVEQIIKNGNDQFADTFCVCWKFDESWTDENKRRWKSLRQAARKQGKGVRSSRQGCDPAGE